MKRLMKKAALLSATFILALPITSIAQVDADRVASVTCAVMAASRNMDSAFRVKEINNARYDIGAEPYLLGDDLIKDSIALGTCELLVKNSSTWAEVHNIKKAKRDAVVSAKNDSIERLRMESKYYYSDTRMVILPNEQTEGVQKYTLTSIILSKPLTVSKAYDGEAVRGSLEGYYADCLIPHFDYKRRAYGGAYYFLNKGSPLCKLKVSSKEIYTTDAFNYISEYGETRKSEFGGRYKIKRKKDKLSICVMGIGMTILCEKKKTDEDFTFATGFVYTKN